MNGKDLMRPIRTWVLISDGSCARILSHVGHGRTLRAVPGLSFPYASAPCRVRWGPAIQGEEMQLAAVVAQSLDEHLAKGSFDRLVIVAPAQVGDLFRAAMSERLITKVYRALVLNLTRTPNSKVADYLHDVLAA